MRRTLLLLIGWAMVAASAFAGRIDVAEAQAIAERFSQEAVAGNRMKAPRERVPMQLVYTAQTALQENCYYVFSRGAGNGFVMVAADDRAGEVLGYADNGTFDYKNLPENMLGSVLYGTERHGNPIVGDIIFAKISGENIVGPDDPEGLALTMFRCFVGLKEVD